jgi:dodecin
MSENKIYKLVEIVGTSSESFARAADAGVERASQTLRNIDWFEVVEMRGRVENGKVVQYQVKLKVGFRLD